jgi:hypothetical protein
MRLVIFRTPPTKIVLLSGLGKTFAVSWRSFRSSGPKVTDADTALSIVRKIASSTHVPYDGGYVDTEAGCIDTYVKLTKTEQELLDRLIEEEME